ncbi:insulinase family protein [Rubellimicrobium arenae]|uniref:insulinase family protein n=1 Tax=Rubellimicrobium arenae TaxID=2817372 RepID=UPI001B3088E6|nr:insulinase family protein [Rubellimicrobium arenae]
MRPLPELGGMAWRFTHRRTGADVVVVANEDPNMLFAITFPTLPVDDTGAAHILEHLVFRGSRTYPMPRPFAGLLQGSLLTYLNATTGPDRTSYHLASQSKADMGNLIDVMLDAVLRPLLRKSAFEEEAWHLSLDEPLGQPRSGGVVHAEMRGHFAIPGNRLLEETRAALLPGTVYAKAYGGAPGAIPDLTHSDLLAFHRRHYHPSNALIFLWGAHDIQTRLDQIARHLDTFDRGEPTPRVDAPSAFKVPRSVRLRLGQLAPGGLGLMAMSWVLPADVGSLGPLGRELMTLLLSGRPDSPLPEILRTLGQGRILAGTPSLQALRQPVITMGFEAIDPGQVGRVKEAILSQLDLFARQGFEAGCLEQALDLLELRLRENVSGPRPRGLVVLDRILGAWRHGADPIDCLNHGPALTRLRARVTGGQDALRELIRTDLVDNPHRVTLSLEPGPAEPDTEAERLAALGRQLSMTERKALARRTAARRKQAGPTGATPHGLPVLSRAELPHDITRVPTQARGPVLLMDLGEVGLVRADLTMDLGGLSPDGLGYAPVLGRLMVEGRGNAPTDLIHAEVWSRAGPRRSAAGLVLRGKGLAERKDELICRMAEMIGAEFAPEPLRVAAILSEEISRQEGRLLSAGHQVVNLRLRASNGLAGAMADRLDGLGQLGFLKRLKARMATSPDRVLDELRSLRSRLLAASRLTLGLSGLDDPKPGRMLIAAVARPDDPRAPRPQESTGPSCSREAHAIPLPVQAVGSAADLPKVGFHRIGAARIGLGAISTGWLWDTVRVAGGAYGTTVMFDSQTGMASFLSFRDPHILRTLDAYAQSGAWLRRVVNPDLLDRAMIGAVGALDRPLPPDSQALDLLQRHLVGLTDDLRQAELEAVLSATSEDLVDLSHALDAAIPEGPVAVLGPDAALRAALYQRPGVFQFAEDHEVSEATPSRTAAAISG